MIFTSSIIDGFKVIFGAPVIHMSMLLTMLVAVAVPKYAETGARDPFALRLYIFSLTTHFLVCFDRHKDSLCSNRLFYLLKELLPIFIMLFQL